MVGGKTQNEVHESVEGCGDVGFAREFVGMMAELRRRGPEAIPRKKKKQASASPLQLLSDPELWRLFRKLLSHPELRSAAMKLAEAYPDPTDVPPS